MPSLISQFYRYTAVRRSQKRLKNVADVGRIRELLDAASERLPMPKGIEIKPLTVEGMAAEWIIPANSPTDRVILYVHGGAFVAGSIRSHRPIVAEIAKAAGLRALLFEYRLAPEHPFPAPIEDTYRVHCWLIGQGIDPKQITMMGDSAGGGIMMATQYKLHQNGDPLPACLVGISPALNASLSRAEFLERSTREAWLCPDSCYTFAEMYIRDADRSQPMLSPSHADLSFLPPILLHVGTEEMLLFHSVEFADSARAAGVDMTIKVWQGMWHVWQAYAGLGMPEARQSLSEISAFVHRQMANS